MTQLFKVTIDGVEKKVKGATISEEVNRFYDVASFDIKEEPELESDVIIYFGDRIFTGFVYKTSKISKLLYKVECRTQGAKLTEPYSPHTTGFDEATTSHELCALYASRSGISITITAENIDFGGSYERNGTMLSALTNIANVTGAEFWDDGTGIQIQPNKAITENGTEIPPGDIFDFVMNDKSVYNKGVGFIIVRNGGSETSDVISVNNIYAEIDECSGEIFVYPNPYGEIDRVTGLSTLTAIQTDRMETNSLLDQDLIRLDCAIESISSITLNGVNITDHNFESGHNVIYFNSLKRGTLTVNYTAYGYKGYANTSITPIGKFITFDIFYLDQVTRFEGFLLPDCNTASTDGDMTCIVPSETYYNQGFYVWTIGGDPEFKFYDRNTEIIRPVVSNSDDPYISVEKVTLEEIDGGYFIYRPRYDILNALGARSSDVDVSYTIETDDDGKYFQFLQYYPKMEVSYEVTALQHYVEFAEIENGDVTMVIINHNTEQYCEYGLDTKIPCEFNQYIPIDIATELDLEVFNVAGVSLSYLKPDATSGSVQVDDFGKVKMWVFMDGDYVIYTGNLKPRTTVTLTSNVLG